mgnify:CR=1
MALSIKNPEADQLARRLSDLTGLSITDVILKALREQLERETGRTTVESTYEELIAIGDRCAKLPILDPRSEIRRRDHWL